MIWCFPMLPIPILLRCLEIINRLIPLPVIIRCIDIPCHHEFSFIYPVDFMPLNSNYSNLGEYLYIEFIVGYHRWRCVAETKREEIVYGFFC